MMKSKELLPEHFQMGQQVQRNEEQSFCSGSLISIMLNDHFIKALHEE